MPIHSYFDNVIMKFMINNRIVAWKTDVNLSSRRNFFLKARAELAIIEWGWVGYEEFCRSRRVCRILDILRKPNLIIALLFIQNIFFAQTCRLYSRPFLSLLNYKTLCPGFLGQWFNNLWRQWFNNLQRPALLTSFWRQWFNNLQRTALLTSLVQYDKIRGQQQLFMVNYACGFNQLETGKYFEWIIKKLLHDNIDASRVPHFECFFYHNINVNINIKMVHIFHFLPTSLVFEIVNPFSRIFNVISSEKSCLISMPFLAC